MDAKTENIEYVVNGTKIDSESKIVFKANPKRNGSASHARYEKYQAATTFAKYLKLNEGKFQMADARHDLSKGFLSLAK